MINWIGFENGSFHAFGGYSWTPVGISNLKMHALQEIYIFFFKMANKSKNKLLFEAARKQLEIFHQQFII